MTLIGNDNNSINVITNKYNLFIISLSNVMLVIYVGAENDADKVRISYL